MLRTLCLHKILTEDFTVQRGAVLSRPLHDFKPRPVAVEVAGRVQPSAVRRALCGAVRYLRSLGLSACLAVPRGGAEGARGRA